MNRVLVVAPTMVHMKNWAKAMELPPNFLLYVDNPKKIRGLDRGMRYVWIDNPNDKFETEQMLRSRDCVRLPVDVNDWPIRS